MLLIKFQRNGHFVINSQIFDINLYYKVIVSIQYYNFNRVKFYIGNSNNSLSKFKCSFIISMERVTRVVNKTHTNMIVGRMSRKQMK